MGYAVIHIIGNLGSDPELRYTANGKQIASFNLAVSNSKPDGQGGWNEHTDWYRCSLWGSRGTNLVERFRKGNKMAVDGRFETREFDGRDGQKRTSLEITVDNYQDLTPRQPGAYAGAEAYGAYDDAPDVPTAAAPAPVGDADIDSLPF